MPHALRLRSPAWRLGLRSEIFNRRPGRLPVRACALAGGRNC